MGWWVTDVLAFVAPTMQRCTSLEQILVKIQELEQNEKTHKDALVVLEEEQEFEENEQYEDEDDNEEQYEEEEQFEEEESEEEEDMTNSYRRKKKVTKSDLQFIDEYDQMMEQYRSAIPSKATKKSKMNNLKHASVLVDDLRKYDSSNPSAKQSKRNSNADNNDSNNDEDTDTEQVTEFRLLSKKKGASKLRVG